ELDRSSNATTYRFESTSNHWARHKIRLLTSSQPNCGPVRRLATKRSITAGYEGIEMQSNRRQSFWLFLLVAAVPFISFCGAPQATETSSTAAPTTQSCVNIKSADFARVED